MSSTDTDNRKSDSDFIWLIQKALHWLFQITLFFEGKRNLATEQEDERKNNNGTRSHVIGFQPL